jgi:hypothetical protein
MSKALSEEAERRLAENSSAWNNMMRDCVPMQSSKPRDAPRADAFVLKNERLVLLEEFKKIVEMPIAMRRFAVQRMIDEATQ